MAEVLAHDHRAADILIQAEIRREDKVVVHPQVLEVGAAFSARRECGAAHGERDDRSSVAR